MKIISARVLTVIIALCTGETALSSERPEDWKTSFESGVSSPEGWSRAQGAKTVWLASEGRTGERSLAGESDQGQAVWVSEKVPVDAVNGYITSGWIKPTSGKGWLGVTLFDSDGKDLGSCESPRVGGIGDWTYVACETPSDFRNPELKNAVAARLAFGVEGGRAVLDDVRFHQAPSLVIINGDFEIPLDKKGRVAFWNEESDDTLLPGRREGSLTLDGGSPDEGTSSLVVAATGDWFGVASIHYPIRPWWKKVELTAMARCTPGSQVQILAVWADASQQVLRADAGPAVEEEEWTRVTSGILEPPENAGLLRPVLVVRKKSATAGGETTGWFDKICVQTEEAPFLRVTVNQVGYETEGPKCAIVLSNFFPTEQPSGEFAVIDPKGNEVLRSEISCDGRMYGEKETDWEWYFWRADFSSLKAEGTYRIRAKLGGKESVSFPFQIGSDVLFRETAAIDVDFFFVQRCGCEVPGWHAPCHLDDAKLQDGSHRDFVGGWHSAGDYNKLNWEYGDGGVVYALVNAAESAPDYFKEFDRDGDGVLDVLDEAWWGAKYLAKLQIPETGGLPNHIEQGPNRKTWMNWCPPEKTTDNIVGTADDPIVQPGEGNSPLAIGAWARLSRILEGRGVSNDYLERAIRLWDHATNGGTSFSSPLVLISTVDLYLVTREERYLDFCRRSVEGILSQGDPEGQIPGGYGNTGDIPAAALSYFALKLPDEPLVARVKARLESHLPHFLSEAKNPLGLMMQKTGPDGYFLDPTSALGCNYQICSRAWSALMVYRVLGDRRAWEYAADQLDFILGRNPYDLCMMEGKGSFNLPRYHHRYITIPGHERGAVPGAIPNGFVRDLGGNDRPGVDLSTGGRLYPSYRTNEPWLVHNVFYTLAVTALHEMCQ